MILAHKIRLDPTVEQSIHFAKAAGVARFAFNWGLAEWQRMHKAGEKPSANKIKAKWNEVRRVKFPWSLDVTKCSGSQGIVNLGTAFKNFFEGLKKPGQSGEAYKVLSQDRHHAVGYVCPSICTFVGE